MPKKSAQLAQDSRKYELTYLISGGYTDAEAAKIKDSVQALLTKHKAEVVTAEDWGKKKLAYRIKRAGVLHKEAHFHHVVFSVTPEQAPALEHDVYLQPQLLRHLLVVAEETNIKPSKKEETPQVAE